MVPLTSIPSMLKTIKPFPLKCRTDVPFVLWAQELFAKVSRLASIATDVLVGRERFSTVLLMRLTETVILWLSDDQSFWEEIETGPKALGSFGLRQVALLPYSF